MGPGAHLSQSRQQGCGAGTANRTRRARSPALGLSALGSIDWRPPRVSKWPQRGAPRPIRSHPFRPHACWLWPSWKARSYPIQRIVSPDPTPPHIIAGPTGMSFDACPWGGDAVFTQSGSVACCAASAWGKPTLGRVPANPGDPAWQAFWECLACLLTLKMWCPSDIPFVFQGGSISAMNHLFQTEGEGAHWWP